ncbi:hypothetical protein GQ457_03G025300 [Hibiscus cannabinus]
MATNTQQFRPHQDTFSRHETTENVNAIGGLYCQKKYNPYSNTYNPGWRVRPNLSYVQKNNMPYPNQQGAFCEPQPSSTTKPLVEDVVYKLAQNLEKFQQETR